jgi:hypothetical protein
MEVLGQQEPQPDQWAIAEWDHQQANLPQLVQDIKQGTASAVSDGSYKNNNGTSAFLLCAADVTNCIIGVNAVPGAPSEQSTYRSKLAGVSGILYWQSKYYVNNLTLPQAALKSDLTDNKHWKQPAETGHSKSISQISIYSRTYVQK